MPISAVPDYLGKNFEAASPGMRFGMYLKAWESDWKKTNSGSLEDAKRLNDNDRKIMAALKDRQMHAFDTVATPSMFHIDALMAWMVSLAEESHFSAAPRRDVFRMCGLQHR